MTGLSLALANLKPGTGKTTSAVWLAHVFAQAGNSVLLVDADPSGSALEWSDLAAMDPRFAPPQAAFPFRIAALPSRELHRRLPEIARDADVVIIDTPQLEDHLRDTLVRSAILLNRCIARAHSSADAREALQGLGYDVLATAVPRLEIYAQSFGMPIRQAGCGLWQQVARNLTGRCAPLCSVRSWPRTKTGTCAARIWKPRQDGAPDPA